MHTAVKPLSYEEWLQLPVNGDDREECVNGVIETMPPAKFDHAWIVKRITRQLERRLDEANVFVADSSFGLVIRHNSITQRTPDIGVFVPATMLRRDGYIHSAPELAVEVLSPSNSPRRVRELLSDYAAIGIPEVWIVDPADRTITLYLLEGSDYRATALPHDAVTSPVRFPSVSVDFSGIWP
jgi:Uma2 family endonuclease